MCTVSASLARLCITPPSSDLCTPFICISTNTLGGSSQAPGRANTSFSSLTVRPTTMLGFYDYHLEYIPGRRQAHSAAPCRVSRRPERPIFGRGGQDTHRVSALVCVITCLVCKCLFCQFTFTISIVVPVIQNARLPPGVVRPDYWFVFHYGSARTPRYPQKDFVQLNYLFRNDRYPISENQDPEGALYTHILTVIPDSRTQTHHTPTLML